MSSWGFEVGRSCNMELIPAIAIPNKLIFSSPSLWKDKRGWVFI